MGQPEALGVAYEQGLDAGTRKRLGAYYTPPALAAEIVSATIDPLLDEGVDPRHIRVCDPAVGGRVLLLAAARLLLARGADPARLARDQLAGADIDPGAVEVARVGLRALTGHEPQQLRVADSLDRCTWPSGQFHAVVTNPPFLGQLHKRTVRSRASAQSLADAWGEAAHGYADTANLFLLLSLDLVRPDGQIGIILPEPLLAARDAAATRLQVGALSRSVRLWRPGLGAFDAGVRVFVSVLRRSTPTGGAWQRGEWAEVAAAGIPRCTLRRDGALGDIATVTADFRDQYYAVARTARDAETGAGHPLVTCGLIDPGRVWWGTKTARLARADLRHPRADVSPRFQRWAAARLVPKVMVATQTRILEAAADETGQWLPVVPVISAVPEPARLWHVLAVLLAPPVSAEAHRTHTGSALSADAIKLSARQVAALPLPADQTAWDHGAAMCRRATRAGERGDGRDWRGALDAAGLVMCEAYAVDASAVMPWWSERLDRIAGRPVVRS